ncbi:GNAT family N-acetyltransferase [Devosia sp. SL43]|uniref:GNAT family N-acetyltransferase n=1 Tax=Devosia sp. SL43 TaxID=2806348 RepID=UPI001F424B79|nr:GNAT family N-acetyltransferase [Devosia sp. SL43]UJW85711.1 GNAT family N-acetyltransferase [Devosia sp. SL43]
MVTLRAYRPDDLDALYDICLVTGDGGKDASALHNDGKLIGHIYAAPYGVVEPDQAIVAEDDEGVAGYIVGTYDTDAFASKLEHEWWPALRQQYSDPALDLTEADRQRVAAIMRPSANPAELVAAYPAHVHMNLRSRLRGQGVGMALLKRWVEQARDAGVTGIHLGASASNSGGIAFWQKGGFMPLAQNERTAWFGMKL